MRWAWTIGILLGGGVAASAPAATSVAVASDARDRARGGEPAFEMIGVRQGLTSTSTFATLVDRHGFVWFAGDSGLHRFDGRDVHTIDRDPERSATLVSRTNTSLAETRDALWILSFGGLLQRLDAKTGAISHVVLTRANAQDVPGRGTCMIADRAGRLWIGTDIGLFRFEPDSGRATSIALNGAGNPRVTALALASDTQQLLVATVEGQLLTLEIDEPTRSKAVLDLATVASPTPVALSVSAHGRQLWLGTSQGLYRFDTVSGQLDRGGAPEALQRGRIDALVIASDDTLWLGGGQHLGLVHFDPRSGVAATYRHHPDDPQSLSTDRVSALALDGRDNLWIGLQNGAAHRLRVSQRGAVRYRADPSNFCAASALDSNRLLVSLCGGSVGVLDLSTGEFESRARELDAALTFPAPTLTAHALVSDAADGYWLPTGNLGLMHWRPSVAQARRYRMHAHDGEPIPDPYMNTAVRDHDGRVWVASSLGLAVLAPGDAQLTLLDRNGEPGRWVTGGVLALDVASDGSLWLGSTQGLVHYDPRDGRTTRFRHDPADARSLSDDLVVTIHRDAAGTMWVGTQAGLNRAIDNASGPLTFRRYGVGDGLPDQTIDALTSDVQGGLWVGTNRGIARYDPGRDRMRAYSPGDGVPDSGVNWRAASATADGSVYFGTASGLLRIFPEHLSSAEAPALMLGGYEIGGHVYINLRGRDLAPLTTTYDQARVRFMIAGFGDHRPIEYRLVGLDDRWQGLSSGLSVGYDPVPPGHYRFEVRQMRHDGQWSAPSVAQLLTVTPPPWRTQTAYAFYAVIGAVGLALVVAAYRRKRRLEQLHVRELHLLANYDVLTGLPNRTRFGEQLALAMQPGSPPLALLFIDLDRFKNINDSLGHGFGDQVLIAAARRLRAALPTNAQLARLGGDEFTVILSPLGHEHEATAVANSLLDAFADPLRVEASDVVVSLSIGVSLHPAHTREPAQLIQYADSAMYFAKSSGRNGSRVFRPEMVAQIARRHALETSLRGALDNNELHAEFQVLFDLASERVSGAEVLLRWRSREHGLVMPAEFIPILEDTGMIEPVGLWLIDRVCRQMRAWIDAGIALPCVAINVSVHQLMRGDLCERLAELLSSLALPRHSLELEVTESTLMENAQRMGSALVELRSLGLGLAIDDFGTGYSSFASLAHLPVDKLKIDKIFVDDIGRTDRADTLCAAIIAMAHNLKLTVVAEGVETELQHQHLKAMGCDEAQGYWYSRPLALPEFEQFLKQYAERTSTV